MNISIWNTKWVKVELYLDFLINPRGWFFSKRSLKILIENLIPVRWDSIRKDLYFSFQKRRSNFSFYISLYYIEVLISQHTWPCIVNCYWSAKKQHKGSANRKRVGCASAPVNITYHTIPWAAWLFFNNQILPPRWGFYFMRIGTWSYGRVI